MEKLKIYTDGACKNNPGPGGWAAVLLYGNKRKEISGFVASTTNNRMELQAAIEGLKAVNNSPLATKGWQPQADGVVLKIELYSDSAYLVNAVTQGWLEKWQNNYWRTADQASVKNQDLWRELIEFNKKYSPTYIKVKGHSDNEHNNRADELAVDAIKKNKV